MYKKNHNKQLAFSNFNQPPGLQLNPENRWIKKAETIPWNLIEERYAELFPSNRGVPAKPLRMALGSLIIQKQIGCSDRELVEQLTENPYFQYFIGLPGYQMEQPFVPSLLVEFRKRLTEEILGAINDMILEYSAPDDPDDDDPSGFHEGGKAKAPTEFGAKLDLSIENGFARIEKLSFDPYNESDVLISAAEQYCKRNGNYPERILADKIYRNRKNLAFCKLHGIRLSGPALGRPKKDPSVDKKTEYIDAVDRIEVERAFSLAKRSFGLGLITTRLENTTRSSIVLSIIAMNVDRLTRLSFMRFLLSFFQGSNVGLSLEPTF